MTTHQLARLVVGIAMEWGFGGGSRILPHSIPLWYPLYSENTPLPIMPGWPTAEGKRCVTIELTIEHVSHLDVQAAYQGCSRAAYLRRLIVRDIERQGPGRVATA